MFADLLARLTGRSPAAPLPALDARLAVGALLVRLAKSDQHYAVEEIAKIDTLLAEAEGLNPIEAAKLRATCEKLEASAPDTATFTALVQENVPYEARTELFAALWQVSLADKILRPQEEAFLADVAAALAITADDASATAARHGK